MLDFEQLTRSLQTIKVLVIGDVMLDRYIHGSVSRISPEAPVPIVLKSREENGLGGAGNVAANINALGGNAILCGQIGNDADGREFQKLCDQLQIATPGLVSNSEACTTTKTRFVSSGKQIIRYDQESETDLTPESRTAIMEAVRDNIEDAQVIIISDYNKGVFTNGLAEELISLARSLKTPIIVDPKGSDYRRYAGATALTPNVKELSEAVSRQTKSDDEVLSAGRELIKDLNLDFLVATRSERGMSVVKNDSHSHFPTRAREVFDVSGAGDTVIASLALALAAGLSAEDAAQISNAAAAVAVSKPGTAQVSISEVQSELQQQGNEGPEEGRIINAETGLSIVEQWKRNGDRVGFTNGCFDILHFGHVSLLGRTKAECDKLIVGLNSDASVSRLKGPNRPINNEHDRAAVLAALRAVDAVVVFGEDTPLELISLLQPDVLFKGADYTIDTVVGREVVEGNGGKVVLLDLEDGKSTTRIVDQIQSS